MHEKVGVNIMIFNVGKTSDSRFHRKSLTKSNNFWKFACKNSKKFSKCFGSPKRHFYRNTETPPKRPKRRFYRNLKPKPKFRSNTTWTTGFLIRFMMQNQNLFEYVKLKFLHQPLIVVHYWLRKINLFLSVDSGFYYVFLFFFFLFVVFNQWKLMVLQSRKKYYKITIIYGKCSGLQIVFF